MFNGKLLKAHMALRGVSNLDLAKALECSATTIIERVQGRSEFRASEIQKCAELLDLSAGALIDIFFAKDVS